MICINTLFGYKMIPETTEMKELKKRADKFKKYERLIFFLTRYIIVGMVFAYLLDIPLDIFFIGIPSGWALLVSFAIVFLPWLLLTIVLIMRVKKYRLSDSEWARFYSYSITNNLELYFKSKNLGMKADYRKNALKKAKEFLSKIKEYWEVGNFDLAQEHFGKAVSKLKKNLREKVIPNLRTGNDEALGKIEQLMNNFFWEPFSLESIGKLNDGLAKLSTTRWITIRLGNRWRIFDTHKILKHEVVISALAIFCFVFSYVMVVYVEIQKEYVFGGAIALFIGLLTIYFRRQPKD